MKHIENNLGIIFIKAENVKYVLDKVAVAYKYKSQRGYLI